ncbi:MAG: hypothetical protein ACJ8G2_01325 [Burkholderiales bacterium]
MMEMSLKEVGVASVWNGTLISSAGAAIPATTAVIASNKEFTSKSVALFYNGKSDFLRLHILFAVYLI